MNVHIKSPSDYEPADDAFLQNIVRLIDKYDNRRYERL